MNERKREFLQRMNSELDSIDAQLDQFRREFRDESSQRALADDDLGSLERERASIEKRSRDIEDMDGEKWEMARREIEMQRDELKASLARSRDKTRH